MATTKAAVKSYIFVDDQAKTDPKNRKLIRKTVMMGKNLGKTRKPKTNMNEKWLLKKTSDSSRALDDPRHLLMNMVYSKMPTQLGNDFSFQNFAAPVEPDLVHDILKLSFMAKQILFPLERCIKFYKQNRIDTFWFDLLTYDATYLSAVIFMSQAYAHMVSGQRAETAGRRAATHYSKTLRLLQERISTENPDYSISDPTILVVLHLATYAHFMNDYPTAKSHLEGLRKMVDMRGGLSAFSYNTKFIIELIKCDLAIAISNGTKPIFFRDPAIEPLMPYKSMPMAMEDPALPKISPELAQAWTVLQRFCSLMNKTAKQNRKLDKEALLDTMAPAIYRLLEMTGFERNSLDEAVRMGLLVFSSNVFLQCKDMKIPQRYLPEFCRRCFLSFDSPLNTRIDLSIWLLMIGKMSFQNEIDQTWLDSSLGLYIQSAGYQSWEALLRKLRSFLWIDFIHDSPGRRIFESVTSSCD